MLIHYSYNYSSVSDSLYFRSVLSDVIINIVVNFHFYWPNCIYTEEKIVFQCRF